MRTFKIRKSRTLFHQWETLGQRIQNLNNILNEVEIGNATLIDWYGLSSELAVQLEFLRDRTYEFIKEGENKCV